MINQKYIDNLHDLQEDMYMSEDEFKAVEVGIEALRGTLSKKSYGYYDEYVAYLGCLRRECRYMRHVEALDAAIQDLMKLSYGTNNPDKWRDVYSKPSIGHRHFKVVLGESKS